MRISCCIKLVSSSLKFFLSPFFSLILPPCSLLRSSWVSSSFLHPALFLRLLIFVLLFLLLSLIISHFLQSLHNFPYLMNFSIFLCCLASPSSSLFIMCHPYFPSSFTCPASFLRRVSVRLYVNPDELGVGTDGHMVAAAETGQVGVGASGKREGLRIHKKYLGSTKTTWKSYTIWRYILSLSLHSLTGWISGPQPVRTIVTLHNEDELRVPYKEYIRNPV